MRLFTPEENRIIKKLVEIFREAKPGSLAELEVARLLRQELNFFALKWSVNPKDEVTIFIPQNNSNDEETLKETLNKLYFDIANFIYFIEELESMGFIKLQNLPSSNDNNSTILYDKELYTYDEKENTFWVDVSVKNGHKTIQGKVVVPLEGWKTIHTSFAKDLQRCAPSIVYPLPLARNYVDNKLKTLEQRQFRKQFYAALWAAILGAISAGAAVGALIYTLATDNKSTTIDRLDLERIESAINSNHLSEPLEIITNDTLVVKQVQLTQ